MRGEQITTLILRDIDEMNLNAAILIGDRCTNLRVFALIQCHFQMEIGDTLAVERIVNERFKKIENTTRPFQNQGTFLVIYSWNIKFQVLRSVFTELELNSFVLLS